MNRINHSSLLYAFIITIAMSHPIYGQVLDKALFRKTEVMKPEWSSLILPATLIAIGTYSIHHTTLINRYAVRDWRNLHTPDFNTRADDILQFAPIAAGFAIGVFDEKNKLFLYTRRVILTEVIVSTLVWAVKNQSHILRPNGNDYYAFPSGHTAEAFAGATLFSDTYAKGKPWLKVLSFATATSVGAMRILKNRHWASDVVAGAGFGILSAKVSEMVFRPRR